MEIKNASILLNSGRCLGKNISFKLENKDVLCIIGEEGHGKSTLFNSFKGGLSYAKVTNIPTDLDISYFTQNDVVSNHITITEFLLDSNEKQNKITKDIINYFELDEELLNLKINSLSSGELNLVRLVKALSKDTDILFLDNPTIDLDPDKKELLISYLNKDDRKYFIISNDLDLLYGCTTKILLVESEDKDSEPTWTYKETDYKSFHDSYYKDKKKEDNFINEIISDTKHTDNESISFTFKNLCQDDVTMEIDSGERIVLIGPNGVGKSTILKGVSELSENSFYFPQDYHEFFTDIPEYIDMKEKYSITDETKFKKILSYLKFEDGEVTFNYKNLSEGQKAKIIVALIIYINPTFLILDEPTRNLSPNSQKIMIDYLSKFNGKMLCASLDSFFIKSIATSIYVYDGQVVELYDE